GEDFAPIEAYNLLKQKHIQHGNFFARIEGSRPTRGASRQRESNPMRVAAAALILALMLVLGYGIGRAADRDEAVITVQVSSADHEAEEGYFSLGEGTTVMVKPGTDLYRFLSRQRGRKVKIVLTESSATELSRLER